MSTLTKSNTPSPLRSMMNDLWNTDNFFDKPYNKRELLPAVNIRETENNYELELAVPGFKKDDFKITTENGFLTIAAEVNNEHNEETENYTRKEFSYASFSRTFTLPDNVIEDHISAKYHDGLLTVDLKKSGKSLTAKKHVKID